MCFFSALAGHSGFGNYIEPGPTANYLGTLQEGFDVPLTTEQQQLLELMRRDNQAAGFPFAATEFWQREAKLFELAFSAFGINNVENELYNTRYHGTTRSDPRLYDWFITSYYRLLQQRDTLHLLEQFESTMLATSGATYNIGGSQIQIGEAIEIDGRKISADLLFTVDDIYNLIELNPRVVTDRVVVGDLGAGWGRIGHMLVQINPLATYVIFDIPESLLVSSTYLPRLLPQASTCMYAEARAMEEFDQATLASRSLWFLGSQQLTDCAAGAIDMLINVASFQEMEARQVNSYLRLFDEKLVSGYVYLRNIKKDLMSSVDEYNFPPRWEKSYFRNCRFSEGLYEAGFRTS
jgi:putative sugar O-methyltransferase